VFTDFSPAKKTYPAFPFFGERLRKTLDNIKDYRSFLSYRICNRDNGCNAFAKSDDISTNYVEWIRLILSFVGDKIGKRNRKRWRPLLKPNKSAPGNCIVTQTA
jgi:hypothetical protein